VLSQYGYAVPIPILRLALRGWGVSLDAPPTVAKRVPEEKNEKEPLRREITGKDGAPMVLIPAGSFLMGSTKDEVERAIKDCVKELGQDQQTCEAGYKPELPQHKVQMGVFYFDRYEVTNQRFQQFTRQTGYRTTAEREGSAWAFVEGKGWEDVKGAHWQKPEAGPTVFDSNRAEHPVVAVSWDDAQAYCRWAEKRLPAEAEWEYAARAGTMTTYWWGQGNPGSRRVENIADEAAKKLLKPIMSGYDDGSVRTAPVGSYEANPWGLHDISGNVAEWTADWHGEDYYGKSPGRNPTGPSGGELRVVRGGSWYVEPVFVRSAFRLRYAPTNRLVNIGFRCAQDVPT
jgi:formylglycine-generating enzyme